MLTKKKDKTDERILMENSIFNFFNTRYGIELNPNKVVDTHTVDFFTIIRDEQSILDCITVQIIQSVTDFTEQSLCFSGISNYIAVPSELVGFAIEFLRESVPCGSDIGVLEVLKNGNVRTVIYPRLYHESQYLDRNMNICLPPYHLSSYLF